jgi:hypothetical protein
MGREKGKEVKTEGIENIFHKIMSEKFQILRKRWSFREKLDSKEIQPKQNLPHHIIVKC